MHCPEQPSQHRPLPSVHDEIMRLRPGRCYGMVGIDRDELRSGVREIGDKSKRLFEIEPVDGTETAAWVWRVR